MTAYPFTGVSKDQLIDWLLSGDVGLSSMSLVQAALGKDGGNVLPADAGDLRRCLKLYKAVPELWKATSVICANRPKLAALISRLPRLRELVDAERGTPEHEALTLLMMAMFKDGMKADGMIEYAPGCWCKQDGEVVI